MTTQLRAEIADLRAEVERLNDRLAFDMSELVQLRAEVVELRKDKERLYSALEFIAESAGRTVETECGYLRCDAAWVVEQCRAAIYAAKEGKP